MSLLQNALKSWMKFSNHSKRRRGTLFLAVYMSAILLLAFGHNDFWPRAISGALQFKTPPAAVAKSKTDIGFCLACQLTGSHFLCGSTILPHFLSAQVFPILAVISPPQAFIQNLRARAPPTFCVFQFFDQITCHRMNFKRKESQNVSSVSSEMCDHCHARMHSGRGMDAEFFRHGRG